MDARLNIVIEEKQDAASYQIEQHVLQTTSSLSFSDKWDHILARWGYKRNDHRVSPGLYALGNPDKNSPIFVTSNYTLSFDAVRSALKGIDGYILVLDTLGVNVWCAAGKGTFGTDELINRIKISRLSEAVNHRRLILPQLGAPGINPVMVKRETGFSVKYGPVRAEDLQEYMKTGQVTAEMRKVRFNLWDRMVLIPIEFVHVFIPLILCGIILYFLSGLVPALAVTSAIVAGVALFPILLPYLPTKDFSTKGFILGGLTVLPFVIIGSLRTIDDNWWVLLLGHLGLFLACPSITAFISLNFTGSTTFTSKSGVKKEMATYIPLMAWLFGSGTLLVLIFTVLRWLV